LQSKKIDFEEREYGKSPLSEKELREIIGNRPIESFLNTRTPLYREMKMKQNPPSKDAAVDLMLKEPNLLRRPVIIKGQTVLTGYDEAALKKII